MTLPSGDFSGIVSNPGDQTNATYLPLESLTAHVLIADISARVVLSQVYRSEQGSLREAHYIFPVPARAAVCSFEMLTEDGRRLKGVVKDLTRAKAEYEEALSDGKLVALLQQFRQDARKNITVNISYVVDLSEDDQADTVRFQLSSHVGARYGAPPTSRLYYGKAHRARLSIVVDVQMPSPISEVISLSHPNIQHVARGTPRSTPSPPDDHFARVQLASEDTFLDQDFLLVVQAPGLDKPRCFAESLPHYDNMPVSRQRAPTTALALTIVPRFELPALSTQEYIFLIDRSGSMSGQNINLARRSLVFLLRTLPATGTTFNIFSFGTISSSLWLASVQYNQANLDMATYHVDSMDADLGGTGMLGALSHVFNTRSSFIPTSVFVLTDGYVYGSDTIADCVRRAVSSASNSAPLRVFTLGVGDGASTELCERIALEGHGSCSMMLEVEDSNFMLKSARLVNAMRVANVKDLTVDWGISRQVLQAPSHIPTLSPGARFLVTAIFPREQTPTEVILRGRLSNGNWLEYKVPVQFLVPHSPSSFMERLWNPFSPPPLIHTLAAHRHIQELERPESPPGRNLLRLSPATRRDVAETVIIELGTRYQVASSHTAFIAVDTPPLPHTRPPTSSRGGKGIRDKNGSRISHDPANGGHSLHSGPTGGVDASAAHGGNSNPSQTSGRSSQKVGSNASQTPKGSSQSLGAPKVGPSASNPPSGNHSAPRTHTGSSGTSLRSRISSHFSRASGDGKASHTSGGGSKGTRPPPRGNSESSRDQGHHSNASQTPKGDSTVPQPLRRGSGHSQASGGGPDAFNGSGPPRTSQRGTPNSQSPVGSTRSPLPSPERSKHSRADGNDNQGMDSAPEFFAWHEPPLDSPQEIMCLPNPLGGTHQLIVCTAPPLPQVSALPHQRSFWSRMFQPFRGSGNTKPETPKAKRSLFGLARSVFSRSNTSPNQLSEISRLQTFNGSFSLSTLPSIVGIPESQLRSGTPPSLAPVIDGDAVWATAIGVAFLRKRFPLHGEVWGPLQDKAVQFGSSAYGGLFEEVVEQAMALF